MLVENPRTLDLLTGMLLRRIGESLTGNVLVHPVISHADMVQA